MYSWRTWKKDTRPDCSAGSKHKIHRRLALRGQGVQPCHFFLSLNRPGRSGRRRRPPRFRLADALRTEDSGPTIGRDRAVDEDGCKRGSR